MYRIVYRCFVTASGTQSRERVLYDGSEKAEALSAYNDAVFNIENSWHWQSPRDRASVTVYQDGSELFTRNFGE